MTPLDRLRRDVAELVDEYREGTFVGPGLLTQLADAHTRTLRAAVGGGRRPMPGSRPPVTLDAADLIRVIEYGAVSWAYAFGGTHISSAVKALRWLPDAAAATGEGDTRLRGRSGLYSAVSGWVGSARHVLGFTEPAHAYPSAACPDCDEVGHIRGRPANSMAWCGNCGARISALGYAALLVDERESSCLPPD